MNIGIIGSGNMGGSLGRIWARNGHQVTFSYGRDPKKLRRLADAVGPNAHIGTPADAAQFGDVVLLATPWAAVNDALRAAGSLAGKVVIDCTNPLIPGCSGLAVQGTTSGAEEIARHIPGARVVKAFNTVLARVLSSVSGMTGSRIVTIFYCGDDPEAKAVVATLIQESGFDAVDAGPLHNARYVELDCSLSAWTDQLRLAGYSV